MLCWFSAPSGSTFFSFLICVTARLCTAQHRRNWPIKIYMEHMRAACYVGTLHNPLKMTETHIFPTRSLHLNTVDPYMLHIYHTKWTNFPTERRVIFCFECRAVASFVPSALAMYRSECIWIIDYTLLQLYTFCSKWYTTTVIITVALRATHEAHWWYHLVLPGFSNHSAFVLYPIQV